MDPGKVGVDGQLEKDINLKIIKRLQVYLEQSDIEVVLTRKGDDGLYGTSDKNKKSTDMKKRIDIINGAKADVMVSIHQNSYHQPEVAGAQVFYYQNSEEGKRFAQLMQKRFDYCLGDENKRQAKANGSYYLLSHSKPVSIIVEAGFLSNPKEASLLETEEYQDKIAWTVAMGIVQYINTRKEMGPAS
ncbi:MAG: N-acetylmuramoyl-L-alanine amidase [Lachnospiraceae bacterium]|jgi:N-acetylmuramoyl-L-alanine amidase|nr:N-acetylmuramoyl-L-alanine amidase [Lachnospiraceae bacterium]